MTAGGEGSLSRKVALVTGAGRGIGRAIALALGVAGASVVAVSRTAPEIEETADLLRQNGVRALCSTLDVSDWPAVQQTVARAARELGDIDILVNNAGVQGPIGPLCAVEPDQWLRTIHVNLAGTFFCCRAVLPRMIERRRGRIVNLSGGGATAPRPFFSAYSASKAAVVRLTETLAEEVKQYGVAVNAIAPGAVNTRMLDEILAAGPVAGERAADEAARQLASGGNAPDLAARLVVFLASDRSAGLTGKLIAAPHDAWQDWDDKRIAELMAAPWLTLRRIDPFTLRGLPCPAAETGASW